MKSAEALVIGGGPAGAASALALRSLGWEVVLLEAMGNHEPFSWKKVCGSFLNMESVQCLARLGCLESALKAGARAVTGFFITEPSGHAARVSLACAQGTPLALRRGVLDGLLLREAARRGVRVEMEAEAMEVSGRSVRIKRGGKVSDSELVEADLVVLADGKRSQGIRSADGSPNGLDSGWYGWSADFSSGRSASPDIELHLFQGGYVGLLDFGDGATHLSGLAHKSFLRRVGPGLDSAMEAAASLNSFLKKRLEGMARSSPWRAVGPLPFGRAISCTDQHFLVGDAAAIIDPFVGGGIGMALKAGPLLSRAVRGSETLEERLRLYRRLWKAHFWYRLRAAHCFRWCLEETWRVRGLVSAMERWPASLEVMTRFFQARAKCGILRPRKTAGLIKGV